MQEIEKVKNNKWFFQPLGRKGVYFAAEGNAFDLVHQHDYSYVCWKPAILLPFLSNFILMTNAFSDMILLASIMYLLKKSPMAPFHCHMYLSQHNANIATMQLQEMAILLI